MTREHYASGNWTVKAGREEEFISRWGDWLRKSSRDVDGFGSARLMRDVSDPRHFVSYSDWATPEARDTWKQSPEFAEGFSSCRELCDAFSGGDYTQIVGV
ncbi:MAG: antibiotic biosynthesis monooxygenase [Actinobacteria bacterium]|nr:antibiotic biosynthesis monooxygenase [Actinomycetota bacterium]